MITDARVLQPEFVPSEIKHRPAEISHLTDTLYPIIDEKTYPESSLLYGPSGTGKTCIAKYTMEQLREELVDINTQYVNCWKHYSRYKTLYQLLEGIDQAVDIHRHSTPKDELIDRLDAHNESHYVVILDEVDQLQDKTVLYDLYQMSHVTMVMIANREEDVFYQLDQRLLSRLDNCARIRFTRYSMDELVTIVSDRVRWGLEPDVMNTDQIEFIADSAAGDARVAIGILRNATRLARQQQASTITDAILNQAIPETDSEIKQRTTDKLTEHQQVLYDILKEEEKLYPDELYERYSQQVTDPKTKRTVRNYLAKLEQYNLVVSKGKTKGRRYEIPE